MNRALDWNQLRKTASWFPIIAWIPFYGILFCDNMWLQDEKLNYDNWYFRLSFLKYVEKLDFNLPNIRIMRIEL